jgi:hypothetical protein
MPTFQELLRELGSDVAAFDARHPTPALLIEPYGESRTGTVDTPTNPSAVLRRGPASSAAMPVSTPLGGSSSRGMSTNRPPTPPARADSTEVLGALESARQLARMSEAIHPDARIEWLVKSDRNPFGALITLGRAKNNDVIIPHPTISKVHVIFTQLKGGWLVSDERSANGTFVNGVQLTPSEKRPISDGDSLRFGPDVMARFFEPGSLGQFLFMTRPR